MINSEEDRHLKLAGEADCAPEPLPTLRHSTAHLMAQAVKQIFPEVKASITATAYLLPADDATVAGATPQSPAASSSGDQSATSPSAPKVTTPSATAMGAAG